MNNQGLDKYEVRRQRLRQLIQEHANNSQTQFANLIGRTSSYVSRMLYPEGKKGKKRIADDMIEHIENSLQLNRGWFDEPMLKTANSINWPFKSISYEDISRLDEIELAKLEAAIILSAATLGIALGNKSEKESKVA